MRRTVPVLGAVIGLALIAGCTGDKTESEAAAGPSAAPSAAAPAVSGPATKPPLEDAPARPSSDVLGPFGLGGLRLGMTAEQAQASGLVRTDEHTTAPGAACAEAFRLTDARYPQGGVALSTGTGVAAIAAYGSVETPEGIRIGSTQADVQGAYPDWTATGSLAAVPGNTAATYRITVAGSTVDAVALVIKGQEQSCRTGAK